MSNTDENDGHQEYRKKHKEKNGTDSKKEDLDTATNYNKYTIGGEPKVVPASAGLDENDNYIHRREQNQPTQKKIKKK
jgi:hypothetical protein